MFDVSVDSTQQDVQTELNGGWSMLTRCRDKSFIDKISVATWAIVTALNKPPLLPWRRPKPANM